MAPIGDSHADSKEADCTALMSQGVIAMYGIHGSRGKGVQKEDGCRLLQQPRGIYVAANGSLLVADAGNNCVYRFAPNDKVGKVVVGEEGKMLPTVDPLKDIDRPLGEAEGEGFLLKRPTDVSEDPLGNVLVVDTECCRVQRYAQIGAKAELVVPPPHKPEQKSVHGPEALKYPRALQVQLDGSLVVCDTWSHRVLRYAQPGSPEAMKDPLLLAGVPNSTGTRSDQLAFPSCAVFDTDGALFVADTNNHRIQKFAPGETTSTTVAGSANGLKGSGPGELNMPTGICIDSADGSLYVADRMNRRVVRFPKGSQAGSSGEEVAGTGVLERPWSLCIGLSGELYVSDERLGVVLKFGTASKLVGREIQPPVPETPYAPPSIYNAPADDSDDDEKGPRRQGYGSRRAR